jgi:hypothetical protein
MTLEEHVKVPIRIRLQRSSREPRLVKSRLVVNKPLCKRKGHLTYSSIRKPWYPWERFTTEAANTLPE